MVRALRRQGVEADIVTTNDNGEALLPVETDVWSEHEGCHIFFHERWSPAWRPLREFQYAPSFTGWFENALHGYDGVHIHAVFSYLSTRAMAICRKKGKPYLVRPLGLLDSWSLQQKALKKRLYYALAEGKNLRGAAAIHCTSEIEATNVRNLMPLARIEVIPHGIDPPVIIPDARQHLRARWSLPPGEPVLLFLSRWVPKKNIPLLLEALAMMKELPWTLMLAGTAEDDYKITVYEAITTHGLQKRVICPGHVSGADKALLLSGADLFVLPSITENFGVAVAEALCSGLPCVVTDGVDIAPVIEELGGGAVSEQDASALIATIHDILRAELDRETLRSLACRHFEWGRIAVILDSLYREVFA